MILSNFDPKTRGSDALYAGDHAAADAQYLLLTSAGVNFALPILTVREILEPPEVTRVPMSPGWFLGLANLRGQILPVIDLVGRLGIERAKAALRPVLVVVDVQLRQGVFQRGLLIDSLGGIIHAGEEGVKDYDEVGATIAREYVTGLLPHPPNFAILLDLERVFAAVQDTAL